MRHKGLLFPAACFTVVCVIIAGCGGGGGSTAANGPIAAMEALDQTTERFCEACRNGTDPEQAALEAANALEADEAITNVEKSDGAISFEKAGNLAVLYYADLGSESDEDSGEAISPMQSMLIRAVPGAKRAVVFNTEPHIFNRTPARVKSRLESLGYAVDYFESKDVTVARMSNTGHYGVIYFSGHGNKGKWCTGEAWSTENPDLVRMSNDKEIAAASIVRYDFEPFFTIYEKRWAITPKFVTNHATGMNDSIVFAHSCLTMQDLSMADAFTSRGAQVYCGWDCKVLTNFQEAMRTLVDLMAAGMTLDDAVEEIGNPNLLYHYGDGDSDARLTDQPKRISASEPEYDDIGALLTSLGYSVTLVDISGLTLGGLSAYSHYAVNCSETALSPSDDAVLEIRRFVEEGGRLYCSDFAYAVVQAAFPDKLYFYENPTCGEACSSTANVDDAALGAFLGKSSLPITFDLSAWVPVRSVGSGVAVLLSGDYEYSAGPVYSMPTKSPTTRHSAVRSVGARSYGSGPIAVIFSYGSGKVVYTSFHLHAQESGISSTLMEYLALL